MSFFKRQFHEFKSIFISEDLLQENEIHANIVTASTMLNLFWICLITWILIYFNVFKVGLNIMNIVLVSAIILLLIPSLICFKLKGKGGWLKHLLFISFSILIAIADCLLKYNVTLIMVLPVILAARYYNKKFTLGVAVFTSLIFILSAYYSIRIGQQDINSYNLIIPKGTIITVESTLRDAVTKLNISDQERLRIIFIHFFLPKMLIFNIVAFACVQISQSGKKMIQRQEEITKQGERIETELNLASSIQKHMLPSIFPPFPEHDEIDIYASMTPAKEIGGDFYDMFLIDEDHLAVCIADVSGKGIPASLFMMISKTLIKNVSKIDNDASVVLTRVNNMLCDGNQTGIFVTSWFGILDLRNGRLEFVNAGHNPPVLYSKKDNKFTYLKTKPNFILAGMENMKYQKEVIELEPGDKLFLYTDGVVETINNRNEQYGEDRLLRFLNNNIELDVKETINKVKEDLYSFQGEKEQFDDITMLELFYKKKKIIKGIVKEKEFNANKRELSNIQKFIKDELDNYLCDSTTENKILLATEEIFINIANYAYDNNEGKCQIKVSLTDNDIVEIIFEDSGKRFNPLEIENPNINLPSEERKIGGLGIYITKQIMDNVDYFYKDNKNILIIRKKI